MEVTILMSTYNGEKYLSEQLESIFTQSYPNISLLVRDDESSDKTQKILKKYSDVGKLNWYTGKNLGCAKSFWHLLCNCEQADYYAFCDQDDVWDADKIKIAVDMLNKEDGNIPLLYCSKVRATDKYLNFKYVFLDENYPADYPSSLIRNIAPGCSFVFNDKLRELLKQYDCDKYGIDIHDWMVYRVAACFGKVIFDEQTHMCYRQHENNAIGATQNQRKNFICRVINAAKRYLFKKSNYTIRLSAHRLEECYGEQMSEKNRYLTHILAHYTDNLKNKIILMTSPEFNFSKWRFKFMVLINWL